MLQYILCFRCNDCHLSTSYIVTSVTLVFLLKFIYYLLYYLIFTQQFYQMMRFDKHIGYIMLSMLRL